MRGSFVSPWTRMPCSEVIEGHPTAGPRCAPSGSTPQDVADAGLERVVLDDRDRVRAL